MISQLSQPLWEGLRATPIPGHHGVALPGPPLRIKHMLALSLRPPSPLAPTQSNLFPDATSFGKPTSIWWYHHCLHAPNHCLLPDYMHTSLSSICHPPHGVRMPPLTYLPRDGTWGRSVKSAT